MGWLGDRLTAEARTDGLLQSHVCRRPPGLTVCVAARAGWETEKETGDGGELLGDVDRHDVRDITS